MDEFIRIALAALCLSVAGATNSQADEKIESAIACEVAGYDVIIFNQSARPVPAGTNVEWSVPFARSDGKLTLTKVLEPGRAVFLTGALGSSYLDPDTDCLASEE